MENERRLAKLRAVFPIPPPVDGLHQCKLDDVAWHCYTDADGGMWLTLRGPRHHDKGHHQTARRVSGPAARRTKTASSATNQCPECIGEGIVPNEDKICAGCFEAGQVVEMDGYNADGEPMCYDCLDARDDVRPED